MKPCNPAMLALAALAVSSLPTSSALAADEDENLLRKTEIRPLNLPNISSSDLQGSGIGPGQQGRQTTFCGPNGEAGRGVFDKDISCDDPIGPDNETPIAVHPTNP